MGLVEFVMKHTERGECRCGRCIDKGDTPDPVGHTADLIFFPVAKQGEPTAEEFKRLSLEHAGEFNKVDPFDGHEHGYIELGGWLGSQDNALRYMALGTLLGVFELLTPRSMLGSSIPESLVMMMAQRGMVTVIAKKVTT